MRGQMCWLPVEQPNEEQVLHIRTNPSETWRSYTAYPTYAVPDYRIDNGSKGWATYQKLLRAGWALIPSTQAKREFVLSW